MPIRPELKSLYPIDWPQISHWVPFVRAKGAAMSVAGRMAKWVRHLGDGRWWNEERQIWRDGQGRQGPSPALAEDAPVRAHRGGLAAYLDPADYDA